MKAHQALHRHVPSPEAPDSPSTSRWHGGRKPGSSNQAAGLAEPQAVLLCWGLTLRWGLQRCLVQPPRGCCSEGRNGGVAVSPFSAPDIDNVTREPIPPGPEAPGRSQTNLSTPASTSAFLRWSRLPRSRGGTLMSQPLCAARGPSLLTALSTCTFPPRKAHWATPERFARLLLVHPQGAITA